VSGIFIGMDADALALLDSRTQSEPGCAYKYANGAYALDAPSSVRGPSFDDSAMCMRDFCYAAGGNRDFQGDLLEIDGIDFVFHRRNPIVLLNHGLHFSPLSIARTLSPQGEYTCRKDLGEQLALCDVYFCQDVPNFLLPEQIYHLYREGWMRGGSIGWVQKVGQAQKLPADRVKGTKEGVHILGCWQAEVTLCASPANVDVIRSLSSPGYQVCGKSLSPEILSALPSVSPTLWSQGASLETPAPVAEKALMPEPTPPAAAAPAVTTPAVTPPANPVSGKSEQTVEKNAKGAGKTGPPYGSQAIHELHQGVAYLASKALEHDSMCENPKLGQGGLFKDLADSHTEEMKTLCAAHKEHYPEHEPPAEPETEEEEHLSRGGEEKPRKPESEGEKHFWASAKHFVASLGQAIRADSVAVVRDAADFLTGLKSLTTDRATIAQIDYYAKSLNDAADAGTVNAHEEDDDADLSPTERMQLQRRLLAAKQKLHGIERTSEAQRQRRA
jgi:hypothetical protein